MNKSESDKYWTEIIQTCRVSGLSDYEWCRINHISTSSFYYNVKRLRMAACNNVAAAVPVHELERLHYHCVITAVLLLILTIKFRKINIHIFPRNSLKTPLKIFRQYIIISLDADVTVLNCINGMCSTVINIYEVEILLKFIYV